MRLIAACHPRRLVRSTQRSRLAGQRSSALFEQGRNSARTVIADFNRKMEAATDSSEQLRIKYDRQQLRHYVTYSLDSAAQQAIAMLEVE